MSKRRIVVVTAFATLVLAAVGATVTIFAGARSQSSPGLPPRSDGPYRGSEPAGRYTLPAFALRNYSGELVRARDLRGKVVLITFLDSQCDESCPVISSQVARTLDALAQDDRVSVVAVAISTDPAEDTPASVRSLLRKTNALDRFLYLGGGQPVAELRPVWKSFHILSSHESGKDTLHSAPVRIYDRSGVWVATLHPGADLTEENLAHDIRVALLSDA